jgi:NAD(P)-dependent dehydrogenase (short-subunit alcohol dehydrogenase family)
MATVLVTGGSSGIGLATVRRLAARGDRVFAASRRPKRSPLPDGVTTIVFDAADPDPAGANEAIATVVDEAGGIDALVNNAGASTFGAVEETVDDGRRVFEVNLFAPMRLARAAIPVMREQGHGRIVNVSSLNDVFPAVFGGWYSASKAALTSMSAILDAEVHPFGISVTVVSPGLFRTEMAEALAAVPPLADHSPYRRAAARMTEYQQSRVETAPEPDPVAAAIDQCIHAGTAPARVIVGEDAEAVENLIREWTAESRAAFLRDVIAGFSR